MEYSLIIIRPKYKINYVASTNWYLDEKRHGKCNFYGTVKSAKSTLQTGTYECIYTFVVIFLLLTRIFITLRATRDSIVNFIRKETIQNTCLGELLPKPLDPNLPLTLENTKALQKMKKIYLDNPLYPSCRWRAEQTNISMIYWNLSSALFSY